MDNENNNRNPLNSGEEVLSSEEGIFLGRLRKTPSQIARFLPPEPEYDNYEPIKRKSIEKIEKKDVALETMASGDLLWRKNPGGGEWLADIRFIPPGNLLAATYYSGETLILDGARGVLKKVISLNVTSSSLMSALSTCMDISPSGLRLAQGLDSSYTSLWNLPAVKRLCDFSEHLRAVTRVEFLNNITLLTASRDQFVICWDTERESEKFRVRGDKSAVTALGVRQGQSVFYSGTENGNIFVWDVENPEKYNKGPVVKNAHRKGVADLAISPSGRFLVSLGFEGLIRVWEINQNFADSVKSLSSYQGHRGNVGVVEFLMAEDIFVTGGQGGNLIFWTPESQEPIRVLTDLTKPIRSITISQKGYFVAAGSEDGIIAVWKL